MILPNCCENWILEYQGFYEMGQRFLCLPCGHEWERIGPMRFQQTTGGTEVFRVTSTNGYEFLELEGEKLKLALNRCCSQILTKHGSAAMTAAKLPLQFECPVCKTSWTIKRDAVLTARPVFVKAGEQSGFWLDEQSSVPFLYPV